MVDPSQLTRRIHSKSPTLKIERNDSKNEKGWRKTRKHWLKRWNGLSQRDIQREGLDWVKIEMFPTKEMFTKTRMTSSNTEGFLKNEKDWVKTRDVWWSCLDLVHTSQPSYKAKLRQTYHSVKLCLYYINYSFST